MLFSRAKNSQKHWNNMKSGSHCCLVSFVILFSLLFKKITMIWKVKYNKDFLYAFSYWLKIFLMFCASETLRKESEMQIMNLSSFSVKIFFFKPIDIVWWFDQFWNEICIIEKKNHQKNLGKNKCNQNHMWCFIFSKFVVKNYYEKLLKVFTFFV